MAISENEMIEIKAKGRITFVVFVRWDTLKEKFEGLDDAAVLRIECDDETFWLSAIDGPE